MKNLFVVAFLFLVTPLLAQKPQQTSADLEVMQNIARTAYFVTHRTVEGFDPSRVSLDAASDGYGNLTEFVSNSYVFRSRVGVARMMDAKGRVYHVWPGLLMQPRLAKEILFAHYSG